MLPPENNFLHVVDVGNVPLKTAPGRKFDTTIIRGCRVHVGHADTYHYSLIGSYGSAEQSPTCYRPRHVLTADLRSALFCGEKHVRVAMAPGESRNIFPFREFE